MSRAILRAVRALAPRSRPALIHRLEKGQIIISHGGQVRSFQGSSTKSQEILATKAKLPEKEPIPKKTGREPITLQDIAERRAKAGKLVAGTAAPSDSDMFKAPSIAKANAKRWDHHLTTESLMRKPCKLKQAARHLKKAGLISLGGGLPCPEYFPFENISMKVPVSPDFSEELTKTTGKSLTIGKHDTTEIPGAEYDLAIGLNYGQAMGSAQMLRWVTEHTELVSNPPYADWQCALTVGSTGALEQALRMLCDQSRGDSILMDEFAFSTALETAEPLGIKVVGVAMDGEGLLPEAMDDILSNWDPKEHNGARKPHVLYTVPSGQNPTGATMSAQRRRDVYALCQKHDVFIIEDEPYYFLQMDPYVPGAGKPSEAAPQPPHPETVPEFLASMVPTLLSMDVDGRVLRMDSFSKVVIPGSRMGWVTASAQVVERYIRHAEVASQGPAGLSQVILHKLLDEHWGHEGYFKWLMNLRTEYTKRRDVLLGACDDFVPREVVSWTPPAAGMFQWFQVNYSLHPDAGKRSIVEIEQEIFEMCISKGVLVARGSWFAAEHDKPLKNLYFRATFAAAAPEPMREAIRRFGEAVRTSFRL
ncbi:pyridoxal phosphate-dependent transferase [Coniella lustricola]|uniref:aromatic-amino-acid transaminase n=1 Tax=Coniella lustricola TaxID=2025994 RepID=A0A2T3AIR4_9PEZI|nr:pyridoxal phosphate-dependent transferase [Coniella lustricola]